MFSLELRRLKAAMKAGYRKVKIGDRNKQFSMASINNSKVKQNSVKLSLNMIRSFLAAKLFELCNRL